MEWSFNQQCILTGPADSYCLLCDIHLNTLETARSHIHHALHKSRYSKQQYVEAFKDNNIRKVKLGYYCEYCNVLMPTAAKVELHTSNEKHLNARGIHNIRRVGPTVVVFRNLTINEASWNGLVGNVCAVCSTEFDSAEVHKDTPMHVVNLIQKPVEFAQGNYIYRKIDEGSFHCLTCNKELANASRNEHFEDLNHREAYRKCCLSNPDMPKLTPKKILNNSAQPEVSGEAKTNEPATNRQYDKMQNLEGQMEIERLVCKVLKAPDYIATEGDTFFCILCEMIFRERRQVSKHIAGKYHLSLLKLQEEQSKNKNVGAEKKAQTEKSKILGPLTLYEGYGIHINYEMRTAFCKLCKKYINFDSNIIENHVKEHTLQEEQEIPEPSTSSQNVSEKKTKLFSKPVHIKKSRETKKAVENSPIKGDTEIKEGSVNDEATVNKDDRVIKDDTASNDLIANSDDSPKNDDGQEEESSNIGDGIKEDIPKNDDGQKEESSTIGDGIKEKSLKNYDGQKEDSSKNDGGHKEGSQKNDDVQKEDSTTNDDGQKEDRPKNNDTQKEDTPKKDNSQAEGSPKNDDGQKENSPKNDDGQKGDSPKNDDGQEEDSTTNDDGQKEDMPKNNDKQKEDTPKNDDSLADGSPKNDDGQKENSPKNDDGQKGDSPKTDDGQKEDSTTNDDGQKEERPKNNDTQKEDTPKNDDSQAEGSPKNDDGQKENRPKNDDGQKENRPKNDDGQKGDSPKNDDGQKEDSTTNDDGQKEGSPKNNKPAMNDETEESEPQASSSSSAIIEPNIATKEVAKPTLEEEIVARGKKNMMSYHRADHCMFCHICDVKVPANIKNIQQHSQGYNHLFALNQHKQREPRPKPKAVLHKIPLGEFVDTMSTFENLFLKEVIINERFLISASSFMFIAHSELNWRCLVCYCSVAVDCLNSHCKLPAHVRAMTETFVILTLYDEFVREIRPDEFHCGYCNISHFGYSNLENHLKTVAHRESKKSAKNRLQKYEECENVVQRQVELMVLLGLMNNV